MMHDLGMNEYQLGMIFSAFAAGYAIFQFPGGIFGDRFGPRFTISAIAVAWGLLTIITAVIPGTDVLSVGAIVVALIVTRFLVGAVHAPFFPVTIGGTIAEWIVEYRADFGRGGYGADCRLAHGGLRLARRIVDNCAIGICHSRGLSLVCNR
jgi:MFS family permease